MRYLSSSYVILVLVIHQAACNHHTNASSRKLKGYRVSDGQNLIYFHDLGCGGTFVPDTFRKVYRICDDCYDLFKEPQVHAACTQDCFGQQFFFDCMGALGISSEEETFKEYIRVLDGLPLYTYIRAPHVTHWGKFGEWDTCAKGQYVYGFQLKTEPWQGDDGDDSALNGIKLLCSPPGPVRPATPIYSAVGPWGKWGAVKTCEFPFFAVGFILRSEPPQDDGDDTAANNLRVICQDNTLLTGDGMNWGVWTTQQDCPPGLWLCGIRTQVEPPQGSGDDTTLNNVHMKCCRSYY